MITNSKLETTVLPSTPASRLIRGLGSTALYHVIAAGSSILLVPFFLNAWAARGYGHWLALTALVSYLSLLDFGGQSFIGNLLAQSYVRGSRDEFRQRLSEGISLFAVIAVGGMGTIGFVLSLPGLALPGQVATLSSDDRLVLFFMGAAYLLSIPGGVYVTAYRATGRMARGGMVGNILRGINLLVYVALLAAKAPPAIYALGYLTTGVAGTLAVVYDLQRQVSIVRGVRLSLAAAQRGTAYLRGSFYFWLLSLANAVNLQGVILVLAAGGSPALVAVYTTHRTLSGLLGYIGNLFQSPLWPELTFLHSQDRHAELRRAALLAVRVVVLLSGMAAIALWLLLPVIYPLWTRRQMEPQPSLLALFLIQGVLAAGWNTSSWPLLASNHHQSLTYWALANAAVTIVLAIPLTAHYGVLGVAVATLLGDMLSCVAYPWLASRQLGLPARAMYGAIVSPLLALAPMVALLFLAAAFVDGKGLVWVGALIGIALFCPILWLGLGRDNLHWVWRTLQRQTKGID